MNFYVITRGSSYRPFFLDCHFVKNFCTTSVCDQYMVHWSYNLENSYNMSVDLFMPEKQRTKPKGSKHGRAEKPLMTLTAGCYYCCLTLISTEVQSAKFWTSGRMICPVLKLKIQNIYIHCPFFFSHILIVRFPKFLNINQNISTLNCNLLGRLTCIKAIWAQRMKTEWKSEHHVLFSWWCILGDFCY